MYTIQEILNKIRIDEDGKALSVLETEQQAFNAVFDSEKNALRVSGSIALKQQGASTFNGSTGRSISINALADIDYCVLIEQKAMQRKYRAGQIDINKISASVMNWVAHCKHADTYRLREKILGKFILTREIPSTTFSIGECLRKEG